MSNSRPVAYDLEDFSEYVDLKRFQYCLFAYSGTVLAIATDSSLVLTDDTNTSNFQCDDVIRLVLEFNENSGRASCIQWIIEGEVVAVGFETGLLVCFNCKGEEIWEFKGSSSAIQSIKVASTAIHKMGAAVWLLYEEGLLITVSMIFGVGIRYFLHINSVILVPSRTSIRWKCNQSYIISSVESQAYERFRVLSSSLQNLRVRFGGPAAARPAAAYQAIVRTNQVENREGSVT